MERAIMPFDSEGASRIILAGDVMRLHWRAGEHIGHDLYLELEQDVRGRPRWLLRRRSPGRMTQRRRLSVRAAQNLLAAFVRERSGCGEGEALRAAARLMLREQARFTRGSETFQSPA